jgi:hypothetical protein
MYHLVGVILLVVSCSLTALSATAQAQIEARGAQRVAVARLEFQGRVPEAVQELFSQRLVEGLAAARFEVLGASDVLQALGDSKSDLASCKSATCYPKVASALSVGYLITGRVSESNKTYSMAMEIINGRTGAVLATTRDRCETCGIEEAGEKMGLAASALRERLEAVSRAPARFVIRSRPPGARVVIDGKTVGQTPLDASLAGGPHHLSLTLSGYDTLDRNFTVVSGVDETIDYDLVGLPSQFPYRAMGWTSLLGGVAMIATGAVLTYMEGREASCGAAERELGGGHCPENWGGNTKWWAAGLFGAGAAAATMGGVFLYLAPTSSGSTTAMAGISGRFN